MLIGKKITLRAEEKRDMEPLSRIYNDPKVNAFDLNHLAGFSKEYMEKNYCKGIRENMRDTGSERFVIDNEEGVMVGDIGYHRPGAAGDIYMFGITIASDYWSSGYGQDAITTLLEYLFLERNAIKVELVVRATNPRAIRCYEKCGFIKEALLRDSELAGGKVISFYYMGILREEFSARRGGTC